VLGETRPYREIGKNRNVNKPDYIGSNDRVAVIDEAARMWKEAVR
jgi:hypothetical protein